MTDIDMTDIGERLKYNTELLSQSFKRMAESINEYCREMEREVERMKIERMKRND